MAAARDGRGAGQRSRWGVGVCGGGIPLLHAGKTTENKRSARAGGFRERWRPSCGAEAGRDGAAPFRFSFSSGLRTGFPRLRKEACVRRLRVRR